MSKKVDICEYMLEDIQDLARMAEPLKVSALDTADLGRIRAIGHVAQLILDQSGALVSEIQHDD